MAQTTKTNHALMKRTHASLALILLLSTTSLAQDSLATRIDEYLRTEMQAQQIPGVSLAVIKDGKVVLARGYGFANIEHQVTNLTTLAAFATHVEKLVPFRPHNFCTRLDRERPPSGRA